MQYDQLLACYCRHSLSVSDEVFCPPLYHQNFGGVPLDQIANVGVSPNQNFKIVSRESIPTYVIWYLNVTDGQTDRRTDDLSVSRYTLCVASRGKSSKWTLIIVFREPRNIKIAYSELVKQKYAVILLLHTDIKQTTKQILHAINHKSMLLLCKRSTILVYA